MLMVQLRIEIYPGAAGADSLRQRSSIVRRLATMDGDHAERHSPRCTRAPMHAGPDACGQDRRLHQNRSCAMVRRRRRTPFVPLDGCPERRRSAVLKTDCEHRFFQIVAPESTTGRRGCSAPYSRVSPGNRRGATNSAHPRIWRGRRSCTKARYMQNAPHTGTNSNRETSGGDRHHPGDRRLDA